MPEPLPADLAALDRDREAQGLPLTVTDGHTLRRIASILAAREDAAPVADKGGASLTSRTGRHEEDRCA